MAKHDGIADLWRGCPLRAGPPVRRAAAAAVHSAMLRTRALPALLLVAVLLPAPAHSTQRDDIIYDVTGISVICALHCPCPSSEVKFA